MCIKQTVSLNYLIKLNKTQITCGIYAWYWYYKLGNRLANNAGRYGLGIQENGTTVLMWCIFGTLICGIGPFIAMHKYRM